MINRQKLHQKRVKTLAKLTGNKKDKTRKSPAPLDGKQAARCENQMKQVHDDLPAYFSDDRGRMSLKYCRELITKSIFSRIVLAIGSTWPSIITHAFVRHLIR